MKLGKKGTKRKERQTRSRRERETKKQAQTAPGREKVNLVLIKQGELFTPRDKLINTTDGALPGVGGLGVGELGFAGLAVEAVVQVDWFQCG